MKNHGRRVVPLLATTLASLALASGLASARSGPSAPDRTPDTFANRLRLVQTPGESPGSEGDRDHDCPKDRDGDGNDDARGGTRTSV